ncbi:ACP S-malonyltransferase [Proteus myxofaciens]|uniref:Malonyl CoA-acyl carrier protein transacylase n=1 Tax=Proteus myxofaciens ATCC 19692 TaxID=1354337 RepID=A0A198G191_9GAMM|nr:ACP S-malonyltransferase [Proteus myxofaciens]OAT30504.1 malonyl CoA-acyl carrier protein transacylase [Proteus myxofaciens ATCC 19692]
MLLTDIVSEQEGAVLLFPGQGTPYLGMGKNLYDLSQATQSVWDCASDISGFNVRQLCIRGPMSKLVETRYQQVAVTTINIASLLLFRERFSFNEVGYSGHSAGEYSALFAADVINLETLFKMINFRSSLMQELASCHKGIMYIVRNCSYDKLCELINEQDVGQAVNICCDNSDNQQVIGGDSFSVRKVINQLLKLKIEATKLAVNGAWHTILMDEGKEKLQYFLQDIQFSIPKKPLIMNFSAQFVAEVDTIKFNLVEQLTQTVRWKETMALWCQHGYQNYIEISEKKSLYYLAKNAFSLRDKNISHCHDYIL